MDKVPSYFVQVLIRSSTTLKELKVLVNEVTTFGCLSRWLAGYVATLHSKHTRHGRVTARHPNLFQWKNHRPTKPNHFVMVSFLNTPFLFVVGSQEGLRSFWSFLHWLSVLFPVFLRIFWLQVLFRGFSEILSKNISCISWNILRVRKAPTDG